MALACSFLPSLRPFLLSFPQLLPPASAPCLHFLSFSPSLTSFCFLPTSSFLVFFSLYLLVFLLPYCTVHDTCTTVYYLIFREIYTTNKI
jgi:hypothetical protein